MSCHVRVCSRRHAPSGGDNLNPYNLRSWLTWCNGALCHSWRDPLHKHNDVFLNIASCISTRTRHSSALLCGPPHHKACVCLYLCFMTGWLVGWLLGWLLLMLLLLSPMRSSPSSTSSSPSSSSFHPPCHHHRHMIHLWICLLLDLPLFYLF